MPMMPLMLKEKLKARIFLGLQTQYMPTVAAGGPAFIAESMANWEKTAEAISGIAADIILEITLNAEVLPGIATSMGPTLSPGKIL